MKVNYVQHALHLHIQQKKVGHDLIYNFMKNPVNKMSERALTTSIFVAIGIVVAFVIFLTIIILL